MNDAWRLCCYPPTHTDNRIHTVSMVSPSHWDLDPHVLMREQPTVLISQRQSLSTDLYTNTNTNLTNSENKEECVEQRRKQLIGYKEIWYGKKNGIKVKNKKILLKFCLSFSLKFIASLWLKTHEFCIQLSQTSSENQLSIQWRHLNHFHESWMSPLEVFWTLMHRGV